MSTTVRLEKRLYTTFGLGATMGKAKLATRWKRFKVVDRFVGVLTNDHQDLPEHSEQTD